MITHAYLREKGWKKNPDGTWYMGRYEFDWVNSILYVDGFDNKIHGIDTIQKLEKEIIKIRK